MCIRDSPNPVFFVDDGYSGTNYDRPGFQSMLVEIEAGRVGIVITKDLSRLEMCIRDRDRSTQYLAEKVA